MEVKIKYEIRRGEYAPCELWAIVCANGREYPNYVAEGTHNYCKTLKHEMESIQAEQMK